MKMFKHLKKKAYHTYEDRNLFAEIEQTKGALNQAISNFEQVVDPTLIDCYIYELKAAQLRYQFLLKRAKKQEANII